MRTIPLKKPLPRDLLFPLFQAGVGLIVPSGHSVRSLLTTFWGLDDEFVRREIGTVFLNGHPLDDLGRILLVQGDVLALSGPMPGLAGAILRKGSPLAAMGRRPFKRSSRRNTEDAEEALYIRLKVFNTLIETLAPAVLRRGIYLSRTELQALMSDVLDAGRANGLQEPRTAAGSLLEEIRSVTARMTDTELIRLCTADGA